MDTEERQPSETDRAEPGAMRRLGRSIFQERLFFFLLLLVLAVLTLLLIWPNLNAILTAIALFFILRPLYAWFLDRAWVGGRENRATLLTLVTFILVIAIPVLLFLWFAVNQAQSLFTDPTTGEQVTVESIVGGVRELIEEVTDPAGGGLDREALAASLQEAVASFTEALRSLLAGLGAFLSGFFIWAVVVLVLLMVMLPRVKGPSREQLATFVPFPPDITQLYLDKTELMIVGMFRGTFLIAIIDGLAMGLVLLIAGVPYVFFLTVLAMFLSLLPMIGVSLIAWPVGILLILNGQVWQGIFVIVAFVLIVANLDTILRPVLVPKGAYLNPALVLLSVFGGLSLMGFIGIIYGPVIMILLITSVEIYAKYIMRSDLEPYLAEDGSLDLEKLGLAESDAESGAGVGSAINVVRRVASRIRWTKEAVESENGLS